MRNQLNILCVIALCLVVGCQQVYPISRWFTSSFHDMKITMKRYSNCLGDLPALKDSKFNETDYLSNQMIVFLDQGEYSGDHLANVSAFLDTLCKQTDNYAVSAHIHVDSYRHNVTGKALRCRAVDDALETIYQVFKRVANNKSEALDFTRPQLYANWTMKNESKNYSLTDLINTSWITSETPVDVVCAIVDPIKAHINEKMSKAKAQDRIDAEADPTANNSSKNTKRQSYLDSIMAYIDSMLDRVLGLQRRLYWESTNIVERAYSSVGNNLSSFGSGINSGLSSVRSGINGLFAAHNKTSKASPTNATNLDTVNLGTALNQSIAISPRADTTNMPALNVTQ